MKQNIPLPVKRRIRSLFSPSAKSVLQSLRAEKGPLPDHVRRDCDSYARDVLGGKWHSGWLQVYSYVAGGFREGWIPDLYYGDYVVPMKKGAYGAVSELNGLQSRIFGEGHFPDLLYFVNGLFIDPQINPVPRTEVEALLFSKSDRVAFKVDNSMQGKGVRFFERKDFGALDLESLTNGVFQGYVTQHPFFARFHSRSAATVRLTTVTDDSGAPSVRSCYLRLGTGSDTHVQSASHVRVPVDIRTGALADLGFTTAWKEISEHPASGAVFTGLKIPEFDRCVVKVLELHKKVPLVRSVGWDVTIASDDHIAIFEWNGVHNDIKFSEAVQGPCFADLGWEKLWRKTTG